MPSDAEIKSLLRGKKTSEKKKLLKEIEVAYQRNLHLQTILEQEKLRMDECWVLKRAD